MEPPTALGVLLEGWVGPEVDAQISKFHSPEAESTPREEPRARRGRRAHVGGAESLERRDVRPAFAHRRISRDLPRHGIQVRSRAGGARLPGEAIAAGEDGSV